VNGFAGRVTVVTGGASGIGRELCQVLGARGARVVVADIHEEGALTVAEEVRRGGGSARSARVDVTRLEEVQKLVQGTAAAEGRLDYLFNNAGIDIGGEVRDLSLGQWQRVFQVNLMGVVHGTAAAYPIMVRQGAGHIVNTASLCGIIPVPMQVPYAATQHAVAGMSTSLRAEGAGLGVKVSVFCPGVVETPLLENATIMNSSMEKLMKMSPLGTMRVEDAVAVMLRGVARNRAVIVGPLRSRVAWWAYRLSPALVDLMCRARVRTFRRHHRVHVEPPAGEPLRPEAWRPGQQCGSGSGSSAGRVGGRPLPRRAEAAPRTAGSGPGPVARGARAAPAGAAGSRYSLTRSSDVATKSV